MARTVLFSTVLDTPMTEPRLKVITQAAQATITVHVSPETIQSK